MMRDRSSTRNRGFVLIVVLSGVLLLSALLFGFSRSTRMDLDRAESLRDSEQAVNRARAGLNVAVAVIRDTNDVYADARLAGLRTTGETLTLADGTCSVRVTEESGRLNLNTLKNKNGQLNRPAIDQFLRLIDLANRDDPKHPISYELVPAVIDWIDGDDDTTFLSFVQPNGQGVEDGYYMSLEAPYHCKNRPMDTLDELQWIKGGSPEILERLRDCLTVTGDRRININAAPKRVIESLCEQMDPTLAELIVRQREMRPFKDVAELKDVPGMPDNVYRTIQNLVTVSSRDRYYRVYSQADVGEHHTQIEAVLHRNTQAGNVDIILYRES
jgi:general secretion pathway protein K